MAMIVRQPSFRLEPQDEDDFVLLPNRSFPPANQEIKEEDDFVLVEKDRVLFVPETLYPVNLLREMAQRIATESGDRKLTHLSNSLNFLTDEHLDIYFIKYITPFLNKLFFDSSMNGLRLQLEQVPEYGSLFQKLVRIYTVQRGDHVYKQIDKSRYDAMFNKVQEMGTQVAQQTQALTQYLKKANPVDPAAVKQATENLERNEKSLRLMEAHLLIYTQMLDEYRKTNADTDSLSLWALTGGFVAFMSASIFFVCIPQGVMLAAAAGETYSLGAICLAPMLGGSLSAFAWKSLDSGRKLIQHWRGSENPYMKDVPKILESQQEAFYAFDRRSTGFKALLGLSSGTEGLLTLPFPGENIKFRFYIRNATSLKVEDLLEIQARLLRALNTAQMTPQECMAFLERLKVVNVRSKNNCFVGFITQSTVDEYFAPIVRRCLVLNPDIAF